MKSKAFKFLIALYPILISIALCAVFSACSATFYSANSQNVPLMKQQGDVKLQGGMAVGDESEKIEFQGAGALTSNLALMINYCHYYDSDNSRGQGNLTEAGLGYYNDLPDDRWIYELYAGYGFGNGHNRLSSESATFKLDRIFLQPNFGFSIKNFDAIVSLRGAYLNYRDVVQTSFDPSDPELFYPITENGYFVIEPALTLRAGFKRLKIQLQISYSENLTQSDFYQDNTHVGAMIYFDLDKGFFK